MKYIDLRERTKEDILQIVMEKNIEIERLHSIIKEVREYVDKWEDISRYKLLEILDKINKENI